MYHNCIEEDIYVYIIFLSGADNETAKRMLEACNGNVDMAVGMHMDGGENAVQGAAGAASNEQEV